MNEFFEAFVYLGFITVILGILFLLYNQEQIRKLVIINDQ